MKLNTIIYQLLLSIKDEVIAAQAAREQQRAVVERTKQDKLAYDYMSGLRMDLFEAMRDHKYGRLCQIATATDIRILNYKKLNDGSFVYFFNLQKVDCNPISRSILDLISSNINRDIASCYNDLRNNYGDIYVSQMFPFIYKGLYITGMRDTGGIDVTIAVQSYL